ncbi:MAG: hypothetical protein ACXVCN_08300 [Bdellovibrio sp.]
METYKPSTPPLWKRFFGNLAVQLSFLILIAGGVGITLFQKGQQHLERRLAKIHSSVQINHSINETNSESSANSALNANENLTTASSNTDQNSANEAALTSANTNSNSADKTSDKTKSETRTPANINSPHLEVYYAEINRRSLSNLVSISRNSGQFMSFNDYSAGILPNIDKTLKDSQIRILNKEIRPLEKAKTMQWFYGLKDRHNPEMEIGMTTFFELNEIEGGSLSGNFEIQRSWREATTTGTFEIQRKSFPANFEIGAGTGFFMSGVMPLQSNLENDDELTAIDVYKILHSAQFRTGESEFVIFVKFEK